MGNDIPVIFTLLTYYIVYNYKQNYSGIQLKLLITNLLKNIKILK